MDMTPVNIFFLYITWSVVQSFLVAGSPFLPFKQPSTPYPTPFYLQPRPTLRQSASLTSEYDSSLCISPIPILNRNVSCAQGRFQRLEMSDDLLKRVLAVFADNMVLSDEEANVYEVILAGDDPHGDAHPVNEREMWRVYNEEEKLDTRKRDNENVDYDGLVLQNPDRWRDITVPLHILTKVLPVQYEYPEHRLTRRSAECSIRQMGCQTLGSQTSDGHYYLCSTCAYTTTLGSDYFPRVINEYSCNTNRKGCMFLGGTAHGSCRQSVFHTIMLRKKPNSCMTVLKDGVRYITDEWEQYSQEVKGGCQCVINKLSPFAKYVTPGV